MRVSRSSFVVLPERSSLMPETLEVMAAKRPVSAFSRAEASNLPKPPRAETALSTFRSVAVGLEKL